MGELTDPEREARVAKRVDKLCRSYIASKYRAHAGDPVVRDTLENFVDEWVIQLLQDGTLSLREVVSNMRVFYDPIKKGYKGPRGSAIEYIESLPSVHDPGVYAQKIALSAFKTRKGEGAMSGAFEHLNMSPEEIPIIDPEFWEFGYSRGPKIKHDPRLLFEAVARLEEDPMRAELARQRSIRSHKGEDRSGKNPGEFYSEALILRLSKQTGIPSRTVYHLLREASYEMPVFWFGP